MTSWRRLSWCSVLTLTGHTKPVTVVAFSPDGRYLASGALKDAIRLWDAWTGTLLHTLPTRGVNVYALDFSPDGQLLACGGIGTTAVRLWSTSSWRELSSPPRCGQATRTVAFSPDGSLLAWAPGLKLRIDLWRVGTRRLWRRLRLQDRSVSQVAFHPGGRLLAAGSDVMFGSRPSAIVRLCNVKTGREVWGINGNFMTVQNIAFSPDGRTLAVAHPSAGPVRLRDVATSEEVVRPEATGKLVRSVSLDPDGRLLTLESEQNPAAAFHRAIRSTTYTLEGRNRWTGALLSPPREATRPITHTLPQALRLWDRANPAGSPKDEPCSETLESVAFSPDGSLVAWGMSDKIVIWDAVTWRELCVLQGSTAAYYRVAFSPDSRLLAAGSWDQTVRIWDMHAVFER